MRLSPAGGDGFGLPKPGMFGTAIAVRVSFRACCGETGAVFVGVSVICAGVGGADACVKSLSDGACEVAGVSCSDGAAMVDDSDF